MADESTNILYLRERLKDIYPFESLSFFRDRLHSLEKEVGEIKEALICVRCEYNKICFPVITISKEECPRGIIIKKKGD